MSVRTHTIILIALSACLFWGSAEAVRPRGVVTPGDRLFIAGLDAYEDRNYDAATRYFLDASTWGVKDAQFNLGVMYYHGQGVEQDLITAYAWFAISAERGDDVKKSQIRDETFELLDEQQRERAFDRAVGLLEHYGDQRTLARVDRWYRKQHRSTGSRVGYSGMNSTVWARGPGGNFSPYNNVQYDEHKFAGSHALPEGRIEYGELELIEDEYDDEYLKEGDENL